MLAHNEKEELMDMLYRYKRTFGWRDEIDIFLKYRSRSKCS